MTADELYSRLLDFGKRSQKLVILLPKTNYNLEYGTQLVRSFGSPGSNYIEAVEAISTKVFIHRLKICREETKESTHWLHLIVSANEELEDVRKESESLIKEASELIRIFTSSILTSEKNRK